MDQKITIIANDNVTEVNAFSSDKKELWIREDELNSATGYTIKESGVCYDPLNICIPLSEEGFIQNKSTHQWLNVSKLSERLEQACISSEDQFVWSLGLIPESRKVLLNSSKAPNFEIEDMNGETIKLSDFKGKKVLIVTWATWCGCRFDVAKWQTIYEELNDPNFEIICVAEDTQGAAVAKEWFVNANATYKCVIDTTHKISTLFGWVNVPTAAWIDETGIIVRVNEDAYAAEHVIVDEVHNSKFKFGNSIFADATKEWVKNGLNERLKQSKEKLSANTRSTSSDDLLADAYFKLGIYYQHAEKEEMAEKYLKIAQDLAPDNWNIHRQSWTYKGTPYAIQQWRERTKAKYLNDRSWTYYEPLDLVN